MARKHISLDLLLLLSKGFSVLFEKTSMIMKFFFLTDEVMGITQYTKSIGKSILDSLELAHYQAKFCETLICKAKFYVHIWGGGATPITTLTVFSSGKFHLALAMVLNPIMLDLLP